MSGCVFEFQILMVFAQIKNSINNNLENRYLFTLYSYVKYIKNNV